MKDKLKTFKEIYLESKEHNLDDMILDFLKTYHKAINIEKMAAIHFKHDNTPLLKGGEEKLDESEESSNQDIYWQKQGIFQGNQLNIELENKYKELLKEIKERREKGIEINWLSENKKENCLILLEKSDNFIAESKDLRKISIKTKELKNKLESLLFNYNLISS
jgi:hypothetical protein